MINSSYEYSYIKSKELKVLLDNFILENDIIHVPILLWFIAKKLRVNPVGWYEYVECRQLKNFLQKFLHEEESVSLDALLEFIKVNLKKPQKVNIQVEIPDFIQTQMTEFQSKKNNNQKN